MKNLEGFDEFKIVVLGDGVLDEYTPIKFEKASPENPIPVYKVLDEQKAQKLGGAANVANLLTPWNKFVYYIGSYNKQMENLLKKTSIFYSKKSKTLSEITKKERLFDGNQAICRIDYDTNSFSKCNLLNYQKIIEEASKINPDAIIFSDYNKGFFSSKSNWMSFDCIKVVDSKTVFFEMWEGCDIVKLNNKEAFDLTLEKNKLKQCKIIKNKTKCQHVVITCGPDFIYGLDKNDFFEIPLNKNKISVNSVVGAGDCFVGILTLSYLKGNSFIDSVIFADKAAKKYIQKSQELIYPCEMYGKLIDPKILKNRNFELAFTNGCFDFGLTIAHVRCLKFAKENSDKLVVALNSDESIRRIKGDGRPIIPFEQRAEIISSLNCVDYVVKFEEDTPLEVIKTIEPSFIVKGGDYNKEDVVGGEICDVRIFPFVDCLSTTDKLNQILQVT